MEVMTRQHTALLRIPNKQLEEVRYTHIELARKRSTIQLSMNTLSVDRSYIRINTKW